MKDVLILSLVVLIAFVFSGDLKADVTLPAVMGDGMVLQQGKELSIWGWADPDENVSVTFGESKASAKADAKGRWIVKLNALKANSNGRTLIVEGKNEIEVKDVLVGEVWLCSGQSNMVFSMTNTKYGTEEIPKAQYPNIRLFKVEVKQSRSELLDDVNGDWQQCTPETVAGFSAVAYHFGKNIQANIGIPVGLVQSTKGATPIGQWSGGPCYKGMIHPLLNLTMRGVIWYQGENNVIYGETDVYTDKMIALVEGWREKFKQNDLPFYYVQLAPHTYTVRASKGNNTRNITAENLARFWDAQTLCLKKIDNCGMVVLTDITGNTQNIHPDNKRDVGYRLSLWAMAKNYGKPAIVYSGPLYRSMKLSNGKVVLEFDHVGGGLKALDDKALSEFQIAGSDKVFAAARATINGNTVVVESDAVKSPAAVRFAWHEAAIGNLGNKEGLPASPREPA